MSFMKSVLDSSLPIWNECIEIPFIQEMKTGTLSLDKFNGYMVQDSIYLKHYARVYGKAIYHSTTLRDIQLFYSVLSFVTDTESMARLNYLKQFGLTDDDIEFIAPMPENKNYIDFWDEVAVQGNIREILMAILPCMLSYNYIFRIIADDTKAEKSKYFDFVQDYTDDHYYENCKLWTNFADTKCASASNDEKDKLKGIFEKASILELDFWGMAYRG